MVNVDKYASPMDPIWYSLAISRCVPRCYVGVGRSAKNKPTSNPFLHPSQALVHHMSYPIHPQRRADFSPE